MSEKSINDLRVHISVQDKVIEHLVIRSELSSQLLSTMLSASGLSIEVIKQKIEQFRSSSPVVSDDAVEIEKRKLLQML